MARHAHRRLQEAVSHDGPALSLFRADIARLEAIYRVAARTVKNEVLSVSPDDYSPAAAARALARVRGVVSDLDRASARWLDVSVSRHYDKAAAKARTSLRILGKKPRRKPYVEHRRSLIDDTSELLRRSNKSIVDTAAKVLALTAMAARHVAAQQTIVQEFSFSQIEKQVSAAASRAVAKEEAVGTLVKVVRNKLTNLIGEGQFIDVNGRHYNMRAYAKMVAHTTLAESQTAATLDLCREYDNDLVKWSDHQTECEECQKYEGLVFSISGRHPDYPALEEEPPIHPNCEHSLLPTSDIAIAVEKKHGHYQTPGELIGG